MFGSGATIGMEITAVAAKQILQALLPVRAAFCVVAAGTALLGIAASRIASTTVPTFVAASSVFGLFFPQNSGWLSGYACELKYEF